MIDDRKIELMTRLVDEYISSAHPVGSLVLVERYRLTVSSATIRNEMALLEEAGYTYQPYTSAGRVPTERGYQLYIQHMKPSRLSAKYSDQLKEIYSSLKTAHPTELKQLSRALSDLAGEIAFVASHEGVSCSGVAYLCSKPEFRDQEFMKDIGWILDNLEDVIEGIQPHLEKKPVMFVGDPRFFSRNCSVIAIGVPFKKQQMIIGIIGPLRMNYAKNVALLNLLIQISNQ